MIFKIPSQPKPFYDSMKCGIVGKVPKLPKDRLCCKVELILVAVTRPEVQIANLGDIRP